MKTDRISVKVVPKASRDEISGWLGGALKIRVQAPPEDGRANQRVCQLLAAQLGLPNGAVRVVAGHSNPRKTVEIHGLMPEEIRMRLVKTERPREVANPPGKGRLAGGTSALAKSSDS